MLAKKKVESEVTRLSDTILDGLYYFGGKNGKGELQGKLRYLKLHCIEGKVTQVEW